MTQTTDDFTPNSPQVNQILEAIQGLSQTVDRLGQTVDHLSEDVEQIKQDLEVANQNTNAFNQKFDNYQKATQWVVQLAFSLIAAATVTVIVSTVLGK